MKRWSAGAPPRPTRESEAKPRLWVRLEFCGLEVGSQFCYEATDLGTQGHPRDRIPSPWMHKTLCDYAHAVSGAVPDIRVMESYGLGMQPSDRAAVGMNETLVQPLTLPQKHKTKTQLSLIRIS